MQVTWCRPVTSCWGVVLMAVALWLKVQLRDSGVPLAKPHTSVKDDRESGATAGAAAALTHVGGTDDGLAGRTGTARALHLPPRGARLAGGLRADRVTGPYARGRDEPRRPAGALLPDAPAPAGASAGDRHSGRRVRGPPRRGTRRRARRLGRASAAHGGHQGRERR